MEGRKQEAGSLLEDKIQNCLTIKMIDDVKFLNRQEKLKELLILIKRLSFYLIRDNSGWP